MSDLLIVIAIICYLTIATFVTVLLSGDDIDGFYAIVGLVWPISACGVLAIGGFVLPLFGAYILAMWIREKVGWA